MCGNRMESRLVCCMPLLSVSLVDCKPHSSLARINSNPSQHKLATVCKPCGVTQDAQTEEVQAYFCQWGPVNSCQLAHNDSALIALIAQQGHLQVPILALMACTCNLQRLLACCGVASSTGRYCFTLGAMSHRVTDKCPCTAFYMFWHCLVPGTPVQYFSMFQ